ncbi:MAG: transposase [Paracoccaceae bacterium]
MSSYIRLRRPGGRFFFTVALADRRSRLLVERIDDLRAAYGAVAAARPFRTEAIVVMPDHLHAVWSLPDGDTDYSTRWGAIKAGFTMSLRRAGFSPPTDLPVVRSGRYAGLKPGLRVDRRERGVWQRRFWEHTIRDEIDFAGCVQYCHFNPVKHGEVERPENWPYSSIHREIREGRWVA